MGHRFALAPDLALTPALKLRYVAAHFNGYAESGSSANLTVGDRNFQALEERAELNLANVQYWNGQRIAFRATVGALAQRRTGASNVSAALLGTTFLTLTPDKDKLVGLYGGGGFDWQAGNSVLFAAGEVTALNDSSTSFAGKGGIHRV